MDSRKRIKTVVWMQINRRVVDDNKKAYFSKRISVDRALDWQNNNLISTYITVFCTLQQHRRDEEPNFRCLFVLLTSFTKQTLLWAKESLTNDDDDDSNGNENSKKAILIALDWQKTTLPWITLFCRFLCRHCNTAKLKCGLRSRFFAKTST